MFFFARSWGDSNWVAPECAAQSLGLFAGHSADACRIGGDFFAELPSPHAALRRGWRVARSGAGSCVLLLGVIDNLPDLAQQLGLHGPPEQIYAAAVERWGLDADRRRSGQAAAPRRDRRHAGLRGLPGRADPFRRRRTGPRRNRAGV